MSKIFSNISKFLAKWNFKISKRPLTKKFILILSFLSLSIYFLCLVSYGATGEGEEEQTINAVLDKNVDKLRKRSSSSSSSSSSDPDNTATGTETTDNENEGETMSPDYPGVVGEGPKGHYLPRCIIIGVRKCGTRALIDMLNLHPQVEKSPLEIHFFDRDENYIKGLEWYAAQMPETFPNQIAIEKSPSYFVTPEVPERIYEMNSSIKLLLIVREPVTRIISDYTQIYLQQAAGTFNTPSNATAGVGVTGVQPQPSLEELVLNSGHINTNYKAIRISMYSRYMRRWLDVFPQEQILVIDGDALIRDPYNVLRDVERFLGLEHKLQRDNFYFNNTKGFYCWRSYNKLIHCLNDSKGRRHPVVKVGLIRTLREFYRKINYEFYEMIGRDFGWPER